MLFRSLVDVALGLLPEPVKPKVDTPDRRRVSPDAAGTAPSGELTERAARVHDAFCGSGCVGISIAAERPDIQLELSDLSEHALAVAAINAGALLPGCFVGFGCGTVLSSATGRFDLITANPPYVSSSFVDGIRLDCTMEPRLALDGGPDGLALYPEIVKQARPLLINRGYLVLEIGDEQAADVVAIMQLGGFATVTVHHDLAGHDRVVSGVRHEIRRQS